MGMRYWDVTFSTNSDFLDIILFINTVYRLESRVFFHSDVNKNK